VASDPPLNLEQLVAPILRKTFELRRAYEQKLRLLTDLQHEIDIVRTADTPFPRRRQGLENVELHFRDLAKADGSTDDLLKAIREEFDAIHNEIHEVEKKQRER
jgi:hypothetical protein